MNTYDVLKVSLVFPEMMNDKLTSLMVWLSHVQLEVKVGSSQWIFLLMIVRQGTDLKDDRQNPNPMFAGSNPQN